MKVLLQQQHDFYSRTGGAETQFLAYHQGLNQFGIHADISLDMAPNLSSYDLVHVFNVVNFNDTLLQIQNAKRQRKPVFLSTVYWNTEEVWAERIKLEEVTKDVAMKEYIRSRERISSLVSLADVLLPNSITEYGVLAADCYPGKNSLQPWYVIRNGVDPIFESGDKQKFFSKYGLKDFVVFVGRIELRKNVLNLCKAFLNSELQLVIVGPTYLSGLDKEYADKCKEISSNNIIFLDKMDRSELMDLYASAQVIVQPSFFETPGLAALEAGLAGCNVVVSNRGCTVEYFGDTVEYCNPQDPNSIITACKKAYYKYKNSNLKDLILKKYLWRYGIKDLINAYEKGLEALK